MKKKTLFIVTTVPETLDTILKNQPKFLNNTLSISNEAAPGVVPDSVKIAFGVGALVFIT